MVTWRVGKLNMPIILGVDPGSCSTGYGIVRCENQQLTYLASGCIQLRREVFAERLKHIFNDLQSLLVEYKPTEMAIEQVFFHINASAALKLGQARGAAIAAAAVAQLNVSEYSARQVKKAVVGYGAASKQQVQEMIRLRLHLTRTPQSDAADALALAVCHAQSRSLQMALTVHAARSKLLFRRGRLR